MADAVVTMGARWDGSQVSRGLKNTKQEVDSLKRAVGNFSSFAVGLAGFGGVLALVSQVGNGLKELAEEQRVNNALFQTVRRTGHLLAGTYDEISAAVLNMRNNSLFGDTEITRGLNNLISLTGDYRGSLNNLQLAVDLAADRNISLEQSTKLIAFAMKGVVEPLNEVSVKVREWARANQELINTKEGAAEVLAIMRGDTSGQAKAQMDGLAGSVKTLAEGWREYRDAMIETLTKMPGAQDQATGLGEYLGRAAEVERNAQKVREGWLDRFRRSIEDFKLEVKTYEDAAGLTHLSIGVAPRPPRVVPGSTFGLEPFAPGIFDGDRLLRDSESFIDQMQAQNERRLEIGREVWMEEQARLEKEAAESAALRAKAYESIMEDARETAATLKEFADRRKSVAEEEAQRRVAEAENQRLRHVAELQSAFAGAFMSIRSGWEGLVDYMRDYLMQRLAWFIAGKLANSIFPGLGVAVGAGGGGGGTPDTLPGYPPSTAVGASRAVMQQNAWRMQRSLR